MFKRQGEKNTEEKTQDRWKKTEGNGLIKRQTKHNTTPTVQGKPWKNPTAESVKGYTEKSN